MLISLEELLNVVELVSVEDALQEEYQHPRMTPVLGLGNQALIRNRNKSELPPILNRQIKTTIESHNSLLIKFWDEIDVLIR